MKVCGLLSVMLNVAPARLTTSVVLIVNHAVVSSQQHVQRTVEPQHPSTETGNWSSVQTRTVDLKRQNS